MSYHVTETAHVLTTDVQNPFAEFADKRERHSWQHSAVIKAGTRFILRRIDVGQEFRRIEGNHIKPGMVYRTELQLDQSGWGSDPSKGYGPSLSLSRETTIEGMFSSVAYSEGEDKTAETTRERKVAAAKIQFEKNLMAALSQPIKDFRSSFLQTAEHTCHSASDLLHLLFLQGRVTLDELEALQTQAEAKAEAEREIEEKAAEAERALRNQPQA